MLRILTLVLCIGVANASVVSKSAKYLGIKVDYKVVLPDGFDASKEYPAVLAFSGGPQTMETVDRSIDRYWHAAEKRGYIVVIPAAPGGRLFFQDGTFIFPEFIDQILKDYKVQSGKLHIAGVSNGGLSAFQIAAMYPQYFWSVTGFPGLLFQPTASKIDAFKPLCIFMEVGEQDDWVTAMQQTADTFKNKGYSVNFRIDAGQPHSINLGTEGVNRLFDQFDQSAKGCSK